LPNEVIKYKCATQPKPAFDTTAIDSGAEQKNSLQHDACYSHT